MYHPRVDTNGEVAGKNRLIVTCLCEIRYFVGANSFALKIRHGFTEEALKPCRNFIFGKMVFETINNIGVHIVRMNSHLQLSTSLFTQTGYTQIILCDSTAFF